MSNAVKWMLVHSHESGVDTVQFEAPEGLAREIGMAEDETAAMIGLCDMVGIGYQPEHSEAVDLVLLPTRDSQVTITQAELDGLAGNGGVT